jgi:hypothetical protein
MSQQEATDKPDAVEGPAAGIFGPWARKLWLADEAFMFLKKLSIVGLIGTAVGSYFQWVSWREEQNIARYKQDFDAATALFAEAGTSLSTAMNQQQLLYFTYAAATEPDVRNGEFLAKSGHEIFKAYVDARNSLRQNIDTLARKLEIYVDWPSDRARDFTVQTSGDPLNSRAFGGYNFRCSADFPDASSLESLKKKISIPNEDNSLKPLTIDWGSTKHHIITFQYCFERLHSKILRAREWASQSAVISDIEDGAQIRKSLNELVERFNAFMLLTMWQIENIRHHYQTKNYLCHLFPVGRWCA